MLDFVGLVELASPYKHREKDMVGPKIVKEDRLIGFKFQTRRELKKYFFQCHRRRAEECIVVAFLSSSNCK